MIHPKNKTAFIKIKQQKKMSIAFFDYSHYI